MSVTVLSVLLLSLIAWPVRGQTNEYRFSHINVNHGLSHNQIKSIFKDKTGFLWVGTISGLNRYDGYNVKVFCFPK